MHNFWKVTSCYLKKNFLTLDLDQPTHYSFWRRNFSHNSLFCQIPSFSSEELVLPHFIRCKLSRLHCHGHSLFLSSYLSGVKRKNSSCSTCGYPLQDATHLLLDCSASEPLGRAIFGTTSSIFIFEIWSRSWGFARLVGLLGISPCLRPSEWAE